MKICPIQVQSQKCITMNVKEEKEHAMIVKDHLGDWKILVGRWTVKDKYISLHAPRMYKTATYSQDKIVMYIKYH